VANPLKWANTTSTVIIIAAVVEVVEIEREHVMALPLSATQLLAPLETEKLSCELSNPRVNAQRIKKGTLYLPERFI